MFCSDSVLRFIRLPRSGVYAAEENMMIVKVRSRTSEMYPEVKETDKVRDLAKIIEQAWGNDPMILRHNGVEMQSDQPLSVYNVRDGSVVKVSVLAEPPHYPQPKYYLNKTQEGSLPETSTAGSSVRCYNVILHVLNIISRSCSF
nr:uncharacterized protein LOC104210209 [Ipomoea batatas]GMD39489.1 uncharacterized protein LOC104210209 [Ipomoea batatas]GMD46177.1 uncharacterized protein LOC104210209 [Ipomoea batatas]